MGRAPHWIIEERVAVAESWLEASEEGSEDVGSDQDKATFRKKIMDNLKAKAPSNSLATGRFHARGEGPVMKQWGEISKNCSAFNKKILQVHASAMSGVTEQQKINVAVAMQNSIIAAASYQQKDYEPNDWVYYHCWLQLKSHRKFLPPQRNDSDGDDEESEGTGTDADNMPPLEGTVDPIADTAGGDIATDGNDTAAAVVPTNTNTGSDTNIGSDTSGNRKRHSRGGGKGRTAK